MIQIEMIESHYYGQTKHTWINALEDTKSKDLREAVKRFKKKHLIKQKHTVVRENGDFIDVDINDSCVRIMAWYED